MSLALAVSCSDKGSNNTEEPLENHVYLPEEGTVPAGAHFSVPVYFANDVPIAGVSVPLKFSEAEVECDSVSFRGSRVADWVFGTSYYDNDLREIRLGAVTTGEGLRPGRGLLATVYFWAYGNSPDGDMTIDTAKLYPNYDLRYADTSITGSTFVPKFTGSVIHIQAHEE